MMLAIETNNLVKKYHKDRGFFQTLVKPFHKTCITALDGINLKVETGKIYGIMGPNGAGKTTLIKILGTLLYPDAGYAKIMGHDVIKEDMTVKNLIGYHNCEERSFFWRLTGRQNLEFFSALYGASDHSKKIDEVLNMLELTDKADHRFDSYSTGMKQKMSIARTLLNDPKVILMDEPTKGLDPIMKDRIHSFIKDILIKKEDKTILLATHDAYEAQTICDEIAVLRTGKIMNKIIVDDTVDIKKELMDGAKI